MPTFFSHAVSAVAIGKLLPIKQTTIKFWLLAIFCAMIPDADVLAFDFGIPYAHMFGHRGFSHSLFFAFLLGIVITTLFYRNFRLFSRKWWLYAFFFSLITASHGILDAMTSGGLGIAFFAPFDTTRYFLPFRPIKVSPIGISRFFSEWGFKVVLSELFWIWLPSIFIILLSKVYRKGK